MRKILAITIIACILPLLSPAQNNSSAGESIASKRQTGSSDGQPIISAPALAERLRAKINYDSLSRTGVISREGREVRFIVDSPYFLINQTQIIKSDAPRVVSSGLVFSQTSLQQISDGLSSLKGPPQTRPHYSIAAIIIDPGHGGKDPGAQGSYVKNGKTIQVDEKDITLKVGLDLYNQLREHYPNRKILMTRKTDTYPTLEDRVDLANQVPLADNEAIIFVSIHVNASLAPSATGFEVWYLDPDYRRSVIDREDVKSFDDSVAPVLNAMLEEEFTTESILLAQRIANSLDASISTQSPNRGIRSEKLFVNRNAKMPSVLVETGFISNPTEIKLLSDPDYLHKVSHGIYSGIIDFIAYFENIGLTPVSP